MSDGLQFASYPSLRDRVVLLSGGANGIGAQTVRRLAGQGARVGFFDIDADAAGAIVDELSDCAHPPVHRIVDLRDVGAYQSAIRETMDEIGTPYALVNNAAHDERHDWREIDADYWDDRQAVNLRHQFFAIQTAAPAMLEAGKGSIVNIGSVSWMLKQSQMIAYTTAKSAVHGLTRSLTQEFGGSGVRVNTLVPGWVMTERQKEKWLTPESLETLQREQALTGLIEPDDLASMVLFLCADDSRMCTGQEFYCDGGWL